MYDSNDPKAVRIFPLIMAFQAFAGKPLKATETANVLTNAELDTMQRSLQKIAAEARLIASTQGWPDLAKMADEIEKHVGAPPSVSVVDFVRKIDGSTVALTELLAVRSAVQSIGFWPEHKLTVQDVRNIAKAAGVQFDDIRDFAKL